MALHINKDTKILKKKFDYDKVYMPEVGMLGTEYVGSDRYAVVCIEVKTPKKIIITRLYGLDEDMINDNPDIYTNSEGVMYLDEKYWKKYHADIPEIWSLRKNNKWCQSGESKRSSSIHWGIASPYRDPNF